MKTYREAELAFIESIESSWKGHELFIFWLVRHLKPKTVVDLGFDKALSTITFAYRNRGHVFGIDWFDQGNYLAKSFALDAAFRNVSNAIRLNYVKNINLIIGPFAEISKTWVRTIDILHIDWAHTYQAAKQHYDNWSRYLEPNGVILVHDVETYAQETGRFFHELPFPKLIFPHSHGLGIATRNEELLAEIAKRFSVEIPLKGIAS